MIPEHSVPRTGYWWAGACIFAVVVQIGYRIDLRALPRVEATGPSSFVFWYYACLCTTTPFIVYAAAWVSRRRNEAALDMVSHEDLHAIGVLVDAACEGHGSLQRRFMDALIAMLPRITADNSHLLDEYRQAKLRYFVQPPASPMYTTRRMRAARNSPRYVALKLAIIEVLSRVGDKESLTMFDELLECRPMGAAGRRLHQAVKDARPALQARVSREPARSTLLRPVTLTDAETLVRRAPDGCRLPPGDLPHITDDPAV
jgi:hypothetical protein